MTSALILLVDDDEPLLSQHERILAREGHRLQLASNGKEALELVDRQHFDLIISDISMPQMNGIELLRQVRRRDLDVPVILVTGDPSLKTAIEALDLGALRYLTKPVEPPKLREVAGQAVRLHRLARLKQQALKLAGADARRIGDRAGLEATFAKGLDALWMAYQPIVSWSKRKVFAYEALLRTKEPSIPHPGVFLEIAERLDRMAELGRAVRGRVAVEIERAPSEVDLFVNLHPTDLLDDELYDRTAPLSQVAGRAVLEITERTPLDNLKDVGERVVALKALGFRTAVDDLGAGYAGLTSVVQLRPEVAKIDMSLVRGIDESPVKLTLVRSLAEACSELDMLVVVEGIETVGERDALVGVGCDIFQGYLFARPQEPFADASWD